MKIRKLLKQIHYLVGNDKKEVLTLIVLFFSSSLLDVVGIGLIAPYILIISNPDLFIGSDLFILFVDFCGPLDINVIVVVISIFLMAIFFFKSVSGILINRKILNFCYAKGSQIRSRLMFAYQHIPYVNYIQKNSSEYMHSMNLAGNFSQTTLVALMVLVGELIISLMILLFLAWSNWQVLILLLLLLGGGGYIYIALFSSRLSEYGRLFNFHSTAMIKGMQEGLDGFKELKVIGNEIFFHKIVDSNSRAAAEAGIMVSVISTAPRYVLEFIIIFFIVLLVLAFVWLDLSFQLLLPILGMYGVASLRLAPSANKIMASISQLRYGHDSVDILYQELKSENDIVSKSLLSSKESNFQSITLNKVIFSYPNTKILSLNKISLKINKGEAIGFIGKSGSGKSTLIDILLGLLEPTNGEILYNDILMSDNSLIWKSQVAYLPQNLFLVDDTLRKNIAIGVEDCDINDDKILESIEKASLLKFVKNLQFGVDTVLGEKGISLSGGQRQRVALARAFYSDRSVLIMDEATSSLDSETEREVIKEIWRLKEENTIIVISHRLTTLSGCDRIYTIDEGKIISESDYKSLFKGDYYA